MGTTIGVPPPTPTPTPTPRIGNSGDLPFDFGARGEGTGGGTLASASVASAGELVGGFAGDGVAAAVKWISGNGSLSEDQGTVWELVRV